MEDHFHALIVLAERELLAFTRILERIRRHTGVLRDNLTVGTDFLHTGAIAGLEFVNEWDVHSAHESYFLRVTDQSGECANQIRSFLFAELECGDVGRWRDYVRIFVRLPGVLDPGGLGV